MQLNFWSIVVRVLGEHFPVPKPLSPSFCSGAAAAAVQEESHSIVDTVTQRFSVNVRNRGPISNKVEGI